ncbi:DUF6197 family protein [Streptantibioticus rubrisoli]|uniref:DUF6197 family protein n=1 Tax=Streptantibioticus rubrisoli TaxID=1387313 RepID=UPI003FD8D4DA
MSLSATLCGPEYARRLDHPPSVQLHVAEGILREWGWQQQPHHLRNRRGARCVCGAICAAVALGVGSEHAAHRAAGHVLHVLRDRGWPHLIGDWNQQPGRTPQQAYGKPSKPESRRPAPGRSPTTTS